ncbi:MAG: CoA-binding protein [Myxococcota bacterium]
MSDLDTARRVLAEARTVAVLGAHADPDKPAYYVPAYLASHGYRILPVNPGRVGEVLHGAPVVSTLAELGPGVDVVDVFRRAEHLAGHLDDVLALAPRAVWLQSGIRDDAFAARLRAAGIEVVQDRCMLADHRSLRPDRR